MSPMKGLELSRRYFETYGLPMIRQLQQSYPELNGEFAAGLAGQGSECLGFDDEYSTDHDFGPSFCIWLRRPVYEKYGDICRRAYEALPGEFLGFPARKVMPQAQDRVGILCAETFYQSLLGIENAPDANRDWLFLSESALACACSGEVFLDENGYFTEFRTVLKKGYPEDIRKKKIAARAALMAQTGQYNYSRLCRRKEWTGASIALHEFIQQTCSMVHLLNYSYTPFYKWMHRSLKEVAVLPQIYELLDQLTMDSDMRGAWENADPSGFLYGFLNTADNKAVLIETICQLVIRELVRQGLSDVQDMYLEPHAYSVMEKIEDPVIAGLPLMYG